MLLTLTLELQAVPLTVRERSAAANAAGIRIWPKRGRALVFWSVAGGEEDVRSLHEAGFTGIPRRCHTHHHTQTQKQTTYSL
jgi:hypothetical protein